MATVSLLHFSGLLDCFACDLVHGLALPDFRTGLLHRVLVADRSHIGEAPPESLRALATEEARCPGRLNLRKPAKNRHQRRNFLLSNAAFCCTLRTTRLLLLWPTDHSLHRLTLRT